MNSDIYIYKDTLQALKMFWQKKSTNILFALHKKNEKKDQIIEMESSVLSCENVWQVEWP